MEMKRGYKQTEVGVVPMDWEAKSLDSVAFVTSGKRLPLGHSLTEHVTPHPYVRVTDMRPGTVSLADIRFVPVDVFPAIRRYRIFKEDIFISVAGTLGIVGKVPSELDGANLTENADRITNITCSQDYLLHVLMSPLIQSTIDSLQTVGAQPKLALTRIRKFAVPLPPTKAEQEAIAEALSDADALIESLEQFLTKKRQIKQGAMQELLTGKRRLPGFSAEWEVANLDSVVDRITGVWGANDSSPDHPRPIDIIRAGDISQGGLLKGSAQRFLSDVEFAKAECRLDDILITTSGAGLGKAWWCDGRPSTAASNFVRILRPRRGRSNGRYVSYVLRTEIGLNQLQEHTATSAYPNLRPSFFAAPWLLLPPISEQMAIATILSDMDAEIAALEVRLAKARQLKQGVMHELLTGRIRLA